MKITSLTLLSELMRQFFLRTHGCEALIIIILSHPQNKPLRCTTEEVQGPQNKEAAVQAWEARSAQSQHGVPLGHATPFSLTKDHTGRGLEFLWCYLHSNRGKEKKKNNTKDGAYFSQFKTIWNSRVSNASHLAKAGLTHEITHWGCALSVSVRETYLGPQPQLFRMAPD